MPGYKFHIPKRWSNRGIHHSKYPHLPCCRTTTVILKRKHSTLSLFPCIFVFPIPLHWFTCDETLYLRLVVKQRFISLNHYTWTPKNNWTLKEFGAADIPEKLVDLYCCLLRNFSIVCSITHWVVPRPQLHEK